jgi:hypothetical protein
LISTVVENAKKKIYVRKRNQEIPTKFAMRVRIVVTFLCASKSDRASAMHTCYREMHWHKYAFPENKHTPPPTVGQLSTPHSTPLEFLNTDSPLENSVTLIRGGGA